MLEVSIGHALVADALELGYDTDGARIPALHPVGATDRIAMIVGIGTDVCDITRIAAALDRHGDRFAQQVLGPDELRVFEARRARVARRGLSYLATRFSAKEAFSKAIGAGHARADELALMRE